MRELYYIDLPKFAVISYTYDLINMNTSHSYYNHNIVKSQVKTESMYVIS